MTGLIGWVRGDRTTPAVAGTRLVPMGDLAEIRCLAPPSGERERLGTLQACYRAYEAFLPHVPGTAPPALAEVRRRLDALAGLGQLRVRLARPERSRPPPASTGRAHLRRLRTLRSEDAEWRARAETALQSVARALPVCGARFDWAAEAVTADFLLPARVEPELGARIAAAMALPGCQAPALGRMVLSGLWAPIGFAGAEGRAHA